MPHVVWSERARYDLLRLRDFLLEANPEASSRAIATIRRELNFLAGNPGIDRTVESLPQPREWIIPFGRAAYVALYIVNEDEVVILALRHSREAGY